jgi:predicted nucleic-acid-binding Zn-ribbon protein
MKFIAIRSFDNYIDANIIVGKLQTEEVVCFLQDEYTVTIDPILCNAIGGIKLIVPENEAERAKALLLQFDAEKKLLLKCPKCGCDNVEYISNPAKSGNWLSAIVSFLFSSYAVSIKKNYRCFDCGYEFDELPETSIQNITDTAFDKTIKTD